MNHLSKVTRASNIVRPEVLELAAYHVADASGFIKLDAMENPYQLPARMRGELAQRLADTLANRYPPPSADALRDKLRQVMQIPEGAEIMLGNGSDELIDIISVACARPGAKILSPWPSFVMYDLSARLAGTKFVALNLDHDFNIDVDMMVTAIRAHRPAVVWLSYPNNPTGNLFPVATIEAVLREAPGLVVVDEAYFAFAESSFMPRLSEFPNLVVMRTLSKSGLAGIRLGYMAGHPEWMREFDKARPPYNVNVLTQTYAMFALEHIWILDEQAERLKRERARLHESLAALPGVTVWPSAANFLLFRVENAQAVFERLKSRKVLVKFLGKMHPLLADCLRVTVSTPEENTLFLDALRASLV
ncbi:MAG TPA: histidinol-phosphate transaminase [Burkholderiaceae bacterium]|nr:histidinol-phosphate transaminase [Burkholderiaceae bacterium]